MDYKNKDLLNEINVAAYFLSRENHPYDTLAWFLAERELHLKNPDEEPSEAIIRQRAAQIYFEACPYDILVWRVAELDILIKYNRYNIE